MKYIHNNIALLTLLLLPLIFHAQNEDDVSAQIETLKTANSISIYAYAINSSDVLQEGLTYNLVSIKESLSRNLSKNNQLGTFSLLPNEKKLLSKQTVNFDKKDIIVAELKITNVTGETFKDVFKIEKSLGMKTAFSKSNKAIIVSPKKLVKNVVTDEGREFYQFFTDIYTENKIDNPANVVVYEKSLSNVRHTEISIVSDNKLIYKFKALAKKDYLYAAAQETIKRLKLFYLDTNAISYVDYN